jgi:hypothetical protein
VRQNKQGTLTERVQSYNDRMAVRRAKQKRQAKRVHQTARRAGDGIKPNHALRAVSVSGVFGVLSVEEKAQIVANQARIEAEFQQSLLEANA